MTPDFVMLVAAKLVLTMGIVVTASLMVERAGPFLGAMIATLPISAGPALVFLGLDHGADFLARSAIVALVTNGANALFVLAYARLAQNHRLMPSLGGALAVWILEIGLAQLIDWTLWVACLANASAYLIAFWGIRDLPHVETTAIRKRKIWEIPMRALMVGALVGFVMVAGYLLGPEAAGYAAPFPIVLSSLILILHPRIGGRATAMTLSHTLTGLIGFGLGLVLLYSIVGKVGVIEGLLWALAFCLMWNAGLIVVRRFRQRGSLG
jgi:hypothetical protein